MRATRNLARTARANPMWAQLGVLLAPFRFAPHIIGVVLLTIVLFVALFLLLMLAIWYFGLDKNGAVGAPREFLQRGTLTDFAAAR